MKNDNENIEKAVAFLVELEKDTTVPKNIQQKITQIRSSFNSEEDEKIKVSKAMQELIELSEDVNMPSFTRTQIYNIVSILEIV